MSEDVVIAAENLSKAYRIWSEPVERLLSPLYNETSRFMPGGLSARFKQRAKAGYKDFYALDDVSFEVKRGGAVGIVGRNGAGKSTLLQLIAGTLQPTSGSIKVNGRVAALLELGAGFNPDFTGRENIFLSGAILGLTATEVERRFDEIAAFADIGDFIEQPVKTYSSGMMMRLAFAVNTCVDPDILIVDEALSVGDAPFQAKCFRRLRQLIDKGVSLLFVSHDVGTVRSICTQALWLKTGRTEMWGEAKEVAKMYERFCWQEQGVVMEEEIKEVKQTPKIAAFHGNHKSPSQISRELRSLANETLTKCENRYGTGQLKILNFALFDDQGAPLRSVNYGQSVRACSLIYFNRKFSAKLRLGLRIKNLKGDFLASVSDLESSPLIEMAESGEILLSLNFPVHLTHGDYLVHIAVFEIKNTVAERPEEYSFSDSTIHDCAEEAWLFTVLPHKPIAAVGPVHYHSPLHAQPA